MVAVAGAQVPHESDRRHCLPHPQPGHQQLQMWRPAAVIAERLDGDDSGKLSCFGIERSFEIINEMAYWQSLLSSLRLYLK